MAGRAYTNGPIPTYAYESLTVSSTAVGLTASKYTQTSATLPTISAKFALITVEDDAIRFRTDGTDPTTTEGHKLAAGDTLLLDCWDDIRRFKAIRVTTDAKIRVSYS